MTTLNPKQLEDGVGTIQDEKGCRWCRFGKQAKEFRLSYVAFGVSQIPQWCVKQTVGYRKMEFRREAWAGDINIRTTGM